MNMPFLSHGQVEFTRSCYPPGTRIVLNSMNDPYAPVESGIRGTVRYVDDAGQVGVAWDNGRSLSLIPGVDSFRKLTQQEITQEQSMTMGDEAVSIQKISKEQLRRMGDQEGLILQGCGGDPQEWLDGINQILTDEGILKKGIRFEEAYTFQHDGVTCLLFPFKEGMAIEMGRLAMWRLQTHPHFGGTWLSDYVPNRLGGFLQEQEQRIVKPDCPLIGRDGNIYNLLGIAGQTLREHGMEQQATEMFNRITQYQSYDSALRIIGDYVNITSVEQTENMDMEMQ